MRRGNFIRRIADFIVAREDVAAEPRRARDASRAMDPSFVAILASAICAETQKAIGIAFRLCDPAALPERSQTTLWVPKSMLRRDDSTWHVPRWIILTKIQQARRAYVRRYPDIRLTRHPITADETHLAAVPL